MTRDSELYHYGIPGQKWGERHYQYEDGSYTPEGKARYGIGDGRSYEKIGKGKTAGGKFSKPKNQNGGEEEKKKGLTDKQKTALKVAGGVAAAALVAYGGYKLSKVLKEKNGPKLLTDGQMHVNKNLKTTLKDLEGRAATAARDAKIKAREFGKKVSSYPKAMKDPLYRDTLKRAAQETVSNAAGKVKKAGEFVKGASKDYAYNVKTKVSSAAREAGRKISSYPKAMKDPIYRDSLKTAAKGMARDTASSLKNEFTDFGRDVKKAGQFVKGASKDYAYNIKTKVGSAAREAGRKISSYPKAMKDPIYRDVLKTTAKGMARDAASSVRDEFTDFGRQAGSAARKAAGTIGSGAKSAARSAGSAARKAAGTIGSGVRSAVNKVKDRYDPIYNYTPSGKVDVEEIRPDGSVVQGVADAYKKYRVNR